MITEIPTPPRLETFSHCGYSITISLDGCEHNDPREWNNTGTMVCTHPRYNLGGNKPNTLIDWFCQLRVEDIKPSGRKLIRETILKIVKDAGSCLDYSDYLGNTGTQGKMLENRLCFLQEIDFQDSPEIIPVIGDLLAACGGVILPLYLYDHGGLTIRTTSFSCPWDGGIVGYVFATPDTIAYEKIRVENAQANLVQEVKTYDAYLRGECYEWSLLDTAGNEIDGCGGYVGAKQACIDDAKDSAEHHERENHPLFFVV